ncbi:MAG: hypothetical protein NZ653_00365 [Anaerolineae bacterium]|nr:hypothetical protein [Anaerolineae bacterium]
MLTVKEQLGIDPAAFFSRIDALIYIQLTQFQAAKSPKAFRELVASYLPARWAVASGFVLPLKARPEAQKFVPHFDLILYDSYLYAPIYRADDNWVLPLEGVVAVGDIIPVLAPRIMENSLKALAAIKSAAPQISTYLLAFRPSVRESTLRKKLSPPISDYPMELLPDVICAFGGMYIEKKNQEYFRFESFEDEFALLFYRILRDIVARGGSQELLLGLEELGERASYKIL